jgi:hypothetical protein
MEGKGAYTGEIERTKGERKGKTWGKKAPITDSGRE